MPRPQHVLIVDGSRSDADQLSASLVTHGLQVTHVETAEEAMHGPDILHADFVITEAQLADLDGWRLCTRLRQSGVQKPILMLSHAAGQDNVVRGLASGADDYLLKPYPVAPLLARLRAHARSYQSNSEATQGVGTLKYSPRKRTVTNAGIGRPARLTSKEAALFGLLYRAEGEPLDRGQLIRDIWGSHPDAQSHAVEAMIYRLRQKIEPDPSRPAFLVKVAEGYCLVDPKVTPRRAYGRARNRRIAAMPEVAAGMLRSA